MRRSHCSMVPSIAAVEISSAIPTCGVADITYTAGLLVIVLWARCRVVEPGERLGEIAARLIEGRLTFDFVGRVSAFLFVGVILAYVG